jgi:phosphocarrier protein HPr
MAELREEIIVTNSLGLHARPAASVVQTALRFQSDVFVEMDSRRVNAKSIMGLLTLAAAQGTRLVVVANGPDAEEVIVAVRELFESGFGEP